MMAVRLAWVVVTSLALVALLRAFEGRRRREEVAALEEMWAHVPGTAKNCGCGR